MTSAVPAVPSALANSRGWLFGGDGSKFGHAILIKKDGSAMQIEKAVPTPNRVQGGTAKQLHLITSGCGGMAHERASGARGRKPVRVRIPPSRPTNG